MTTPVLVSSAGRRVELVRILEDAIAAVGLDGGVLAVDRSTRSAARVVATADATVPSCDDPSFIDAMVDLCASSGVRLLVPTIDTELLVLARAADRFASVGTRVLTGSPGAVEIALDKRSTHRHLRSHGIPTVRQVDEVTPASVSELGMPFLVKPVRGSSSVGVRRIEEIAEIGDGSRFADFIAQEIAGGIEVTVDVLVSADGDILSVVPRQRLEVRGGEVSKAITIESPEVADLAAAVIRSLPGPAGPYCVQIFQDVERRRCDVIEINARFGGGFPLSARAGANHALWILTETLDLPWRPDLDWVPGLTMLRYDEAVYLDG